MSSVEPTTPVPDVTVVIGAYNAMPYLMKCLASVEAQTIGPQRMEVVSVNDGSTDGTGEYLDEFARASRMPVRVIHQANSGSPGAPRNVGLDVARGRYVFFLDADDYLTNRAMAGLVDMADRNGSDVVLGKVEGVNRGAPKSMWGRTLGRADLYASNIKFTLSAQKLFRRSLLTRFQMRFNTSLITGEDALFTMEAYLRAGTITVLADYTCYYLVGREDGKQISKQGSYALRINSARALAELIAAHVPAGERRDSLMVRPFQVTMLPQFGDRLLKEAEEVRQHKIELARPVMAHWNTSVAHHFGVFDRLLLHCAAVERMDLLLKVLTHGRGAKRPHLAVNVASEKLYLAYPYFREAEDVLPDSMYEITRPEFLHVQDKDIEWIGRKGRLSGRRRKARR